jgi:DNA adenine methylase
MSHQPLAEVFGFPIDNLGETADHFRQHKSEPLITNVASVPQRSPFRYPGGKTWLVPRVRRWLASRHDRPAHLIEPFAGGSIIGLTAAFEGLAEHVTLVELDAQVAAVWQTILYGDADWLADQIMAFALTPKTVDLYLQQPKPKPTCAEKAFETLLKNRINRGGILAPGAGKVKLGENGKGIASRWYPATLSKRIRAIAALRERVDFVHGDGLAVMQQCAPHPDAVYFIDPPYTVAGKKPASGCIGMRT